MTVDGSNVFDELRWLAIEAGYRRLAAEPVEMASYLTEAEILSGVDLADLVATAAQEYLESNRERAGF